MIESQRLGQVDRAGEVRGALCAAPAGARLRGGRAPGAGARRPRPPAGSGERTATSTFAKGGERQNTFTRRGFSISDSEVCSLF